VPEMGVEGYTRSPEARRSVVLDEQPCDRAAEPAFDPSRSRSDARRRTSRLLVVTASLAAKRLHRSSSGLGRGVVRLLPAQRRGYDHRGAALRSSADRFTLNAFGVVLDKPYEPAKRQRRVPRRGLFGERDGDQVGGRGLELARRPISRTSTSPETSQPRMERRAVKAGRMPTLLGLELMRPPATRTGRKGNQFIYVENFTAVGVSVETKLNRTSDVHSG